MACESCTDTPWWAVWDSSAFMPRYVCGNWSGSLVAAWVVPSVLLFAIYVVVAAFSIIAYRKAKGRTIPRGGLLWVAAFFVGCGGGHLMNPLAFVWPAYRFFILWDWLTLIASIGGVRGLFRILVWIIAMERASRRVTPVETLLRRATDAPPIIEPEGRPIG